MFIFDTAFSEGDSLLHRADQRAKVIAACCLTVSAATAQSTAGACLALCMGLALAGAALLPLRGVVRGLLPANFFFAFLFVSLSLTYPGEPWRVWTVVSLDGARTAALIILKGNAILLMAFSLLGTNTMDALVRGMQGLGAPQKLMLLLAFIHRQSILTAREMERMRTAAAVRSFQPKATIHTLRTYAFMVSTTILRSLDRAERIQQAMIMRGFEGRFHTLRETGPVAAFDKGLAVVCAGAAVVIVVVDRFWLQ